jgi:hypothetical protein
MARKASSRKASSNEAPARKQSTPREISLREFFAEAIAQPPGFTTLDPVEELTTALDWRIMELINLYDYMQKAGALRPPPEIIEEFFGRQRFRDAVKSLYDQLLEQHLNVQQLQSRRRPQRKEKLIGAAIEHAFRNRPEWSAEGKRLWWKDFTDFLSMPGDSPSTKRQRRSRARRKA